MSTIQIRKSIYGDGFYAVQRHGDKTLWVGTCGTKREVLEEIYYVFNGLGGKVQWL